MKVGGWHGENINGGLVALGEGEAGAAMAALKRASWWLSFGVKRSGAESMVKGHICSGTGKLGMLGKKRWHHGG
jgi:hypothetical protein